MGYRIAFLCAYKNKLDSPSPRCVNANEYINIFKITYYLLCEPVFCPLSHLSEMKQSTQKKFRILLIRNSVYFSPKCFTKTNLKFPSICNHFTDKMETTEEGIKAVKSLKMLSLDMLVILVPFSY